MRWPKTFLMLVAAVLLAACSGPAPVVDDAAPAEPAPARAAPVDPAPAAASTEALSPPPGDAAPGSAADEPLECPQSDTRATIVLRDCDTGVANAALGDCTLADHLRVCESGPVEDFPRCVAKTTERWIETGVIQGRDKGLIQACAADDRDSPRERTDDV
jgi:hypothetical protein